MDRWNENYRVGKFGHLYRLIDDLFAINSNKELEDNFKEIYHEEIELKIENPNDNVITFLGLKIAIKWRQFSTKLYNKRDGIKFFHSEITIQK